MRLIDADAFDNELRIQQVKYDIDGKQIGYKIFDAIRIDLSRRPTIDAAPVVHGRWIYENDDPLKIPCSICGYQVFRYNNTPYCPNCGAKMDLE
jgi:hypothetical protein